MKIKNITSEEKLKSTIQTQLNDDPGSLNVFCAGHFLLIPHADKQSLVPAIFNEETDDPYYAFAKQMVGIFPQFTFAIASEIISANKDKAAKNLISILINDWQLVPEDKNRVSLDKPNNYRSSFYEKFFTLPDEYNRLLSENGLTAEEHIYKTPTGDFYLKEISLRDRFMRKAKAFFKKKDSNHVPVGMCSLELDDCGNISMINEYDVPQKLSDNSKAGCAAGIAQMIFDIFEEYAPSFKKIHFINFMPWGCINPVNAASELVFSLISESAKNTEIAVTNFFLDGSDTINPEDFFKKTGIANYTFKQS
jgi:hypothetical protein